MGFSPSAFRIENPPLVAVLARVRFTPILKIADYIPDFQDLVRKDGFPGFRQKDVKQMKFALNTPPQELNARIWQFVNEENTVILSLAADFLTLTVANYTSFEAFSESLAFALKNIAEILMPTSCLAIGFRSLNVIEAPRESADRIWELIEPGLHGIDHRRLDAKHFHNNYRYWSETSEGKLIISARYVHAKDAIPQDIRSERMTMKRQFGDARYVFALELDHNTSGNPAVIPFEQEIILSKMAQLHDTVNKGFLTCVTPQALKLWGFREISQKK
jgi:uncharacterized protein (TIGR04255 family)